MADDQPKEPSQSPEAPPPIDTQRNRRRGRRRRRQRQGPPGERENVIANPPAVQEGPGKQQGTAPPRHHDPDVTVVVPVYNEEESLRELHRGIREALGGRHYDIFFVDDGSTDDSYRILRELKRIDPRHVRIVRFRRNYGKSAALSVGFDKARGRVVVTMDSDLQDDPAEIPNLLRKLNEGYDLVSGWKRVRRDPLSKTIPSRFFNVVTRILTGIKIHDFNCGLKAYRREVVKSVSVYGELHRYVPVLAHWEGFSIGELVVQHRARKYGRTKWFLGETSLSNRPLFLGGIMMIIVGIQFISIGLLGELISKTKQTDDQYSIREFIP
jgi:glycosyltransferase involved in cell wall biosynthesis